VKKKSTVKNVSEICTVSHHFFLEKFTTGGGCVRPSHSNISRKISKNFTCFFFADFLLNFGICEIEFCRNQISSATIYHQFIVESRCMVILSSSIIASDCE
jgi:hypothetical protein